MATGPAAGDSPDGAALFEAANKLRGAVQSAEYKRQVLGLISTAPVRNLGTNPLNVGHRGIACRG
jgi:hypothetical protein